MTGIDKAYHPRGVISLWVCWLYCLELWMHFCGNGQGTPMRSFLGEELYIAS